MVEKVGDGLILVLAEGESAAVIERNLVRGAGGVPGEVFRRPSEFQKLLLELAARPRLNDETVVAASLEQQVADLLRPGDLRQHGRIARGEGEHTVVVPLDDQAPIAADRLADVDGDALRDGELRVLLERRNHLLRGVAGGAGVPESEPSDAVGVHVLGGPLEFSEHGQVVSGVLGERMPDLEKHRAVALHDHRSGNRVRQPGHGGGGRRIHWRSLSAG